MNLRFFASWASPWPKGLHVGRTQGEGLGAQFMDKVLAAKEAQYGAQPLVSKTAGWYTANISAAEEKLLANWAALQAREASASTENNKRYRPLL